MAFVFLITRAQFQLPEFKRKMLKGTGFALLAFICCLSCLAMSESCTFDDVRGLAGGDDCGSYKDNLEAVTRDLSVLSSDDQMDNLLIRSGMDELCQNSKLFCFPSTLYGLFSAEQHSLPTMNLDGVEVVLSGIGNRNSSQSEDSGLFELSNGRTASCSLHYGEVIHGKRPGNGGNSDQESTFSCDSHLLSENEGRSSLKNVEMKMPQPVDGSYPCVQISHHQLSWGHCNLYHPSVTSLYIKNTCNEIALSVYEPFSTDSQFYSCNFSEVQLGPGEAVSLCLVFLPSNLGLSSAQFILQTSLGGFLVRAEGIGVESPYRIMPTADFHVSSSGWLRKSVSLFNPFDEAIQLKEVIAWVSFFVGNSSLLAKATCLEGDHYASQKPGFSNAKKWLDVRSEHGFPKMILRPLSNWLVGPQGSGGILDIAFLPDIDGKILGAICLQLRRTLLNKTETLMVPLEGELFRKPAYKDVSDFVSASIEVNGICESAKVLIFSVSVTNSGSDLLKIVKITEVPQSRKFMEIKYSEGLLLFPGSVTQAAVVLFRPFDVEYENPCKIFILTNSSLRPHLEIPCQNFFHICPRQSLESYFDHGVHENVNTDKVGIRILRESKESSPVVKMLCKAEADEYVLQSWRNQGTSGDLTVMDEHRVVFPGVPVGSHHSKFVTVKNPSHEPVAVQLIMNSGEIINNCSIPDSNLNPFSSFNVLHSDSDRPIGHGFSVGENAVTEALIHPYGLVVLGPIFFHPSNRCEWRSSVLVRNNLSGVEWLSLQGFGGSLSLLLREGSEITRIIDFDLNLSVPLNISPPNTVLYHEDAFCGCHRPLSKELLVTNNGDLTIAVTGIYVSGAECQLDGFQVHNCKGFSLEPGESAEIQISYQTDFSSSLVERNLELTLVSGRLVIPMKATVPVFMLNSCRKSILSFRVKKSSIAPFLLVSFMFAIMCFLLYQVMPSGSLLVDGLSDSEKNSVSIVKETAKSSSMDYSPKCGKDGLGSKSSSMDHTPKSGKDGLGPKSDFTLRSVVEAQVPVIGSDISQDGQFKDSKQGLTKNQGCCSGSTAIRKGDNDSTSASASDVVENTDEPILSPRTPTGFIKTETSETVNLTVLTGKGKGRKRRKRKGAGLVGLAEVASSHSGASTPSSPLSPVLAFTPKEVHTQSVVKEERSRPCSPSSSLATTHQCEKSPEIQSGPERKTFEPGKPMKGSSSSGHLLVSPQERAEPRKLDDMAPRGRLVQSATFPGMGRPSPNIWCSSPSVSVIAPHARAPGSKLQKQGQPAERPDDKFTYDIWGNHFSGIYLADKSNEGPVMAPSFVENDSNSFFMEWPQTLGTNSGCRSVSSSNQGG